MAPVVDKPDGRSFTELTRQFFGKPLSMNEAWELVETIEIEPPAEAVAASPETVWIGSVGYGRHKDNRTSRGYKSGQADEGRRRYGVVSVHERGTLRQEWLDEQPL